MQCSVCLDEIESMDDCTKTSCNHYFHKNCLQGWFNSQRSISENPILSCPLCRHDLTNDQPKKYYWDGTRELKMFRTHNCEIRYYRNKSIKYRLYFNSNNDIISGTIFNSDRTKSLEYNDIHPDIIGSLRNNDDYIHNII